MSNTLSISEMLKNYGRCTAKYHGHGVFTLHDGDTITCQFRAIQLTEGKILVAARLRGKYMLRFNDIKSFRGKTRDGRIIFSQHQIYSGKTRDGRPIFTQHQLYIRNTWTSPHSTYALIMLQEIIVEEENKRDTKTLIFGLTNFKTIKNFTLSFKPSEKIGRVFIKVLQDYEGTQDRLNILHNIEVTCELHITISDQLSVLEAEESVDNLCYIFSVASGTKIQWIYFQEHDENKNFIRVTHRHHITKNYSASRIIPEGQEMIKYIEQVYPTYAQRNPVLKFDMGIIDAYLDAKSEEDYLETRGVKLAVALEALKATFINIPEYKHAEYIIDPDVFNILVPDVQEAIKSELLKTGKTNANHRRSIANKVYEINRKNFSDILNTLFKYINFRFDNNELRLFIKCRNSLVHQGMFYCVTATQEDREKCPPKDDIIEEFKFMVDFLDRIFLRLLDYHGAYISHRTPGRSIIVHI